MRRRRGIRWLGSLGGQLILNGSQPTGHGPACGGQIVFRHRGRRFKIVRNGKKAPCRRRKSRRRFGRYRFRTRFGINRLFCHFRRSGRSGSHRRRRLFGHRRLFGSNSRLSRFRRRGRLGMSCQLFRFSRSLRLGERRRLRLQQRSGSGAYFRNNLNRLFGVGGDKLLRLGQKVWAGGDRLGNGRLGFGRRRWRRGKVRPKRIHAAGAEGPVGVAFIQQHLPHGARQRGNQASRRTRQKLELDRIKPVSSRSADVGRRNPKGGVRRQADIAFSAFHPNPPARPLSGCGARGGNRTW